MQPLGIPNGPSIPRMNSEDVAAESPALPPPRYPRKTPLPVGHLNLDGGSHQLTLSYRLLPSKRRKPDPNEAVPTPLRLPAGRISRLRPSPGVDRFTPTHIAANQTLRSRRGAV